MTKKKSFVLYHDYLQHVGHLSNEEAGMLFKAILYYVNGMPHDLEGPVLMAFSFISSQLERDLERYEARCQRNKEIALERERKKRESTNVHER